MFENRRSAATLRNEWQVRELHPAGGAYEALLGTGPPAAWEKKVRELEEERGRELEKFAHRSPNSLVVSSSLLLTR
jgi:hypothetical protein